MNCSLPILCDAFILNNQINLKYRIAQNVGGGEHCGNHFEVYLDGKTLAN